jgi:aspartyl-tRNA(Asn)/glutamyl-tRNA(Gln) amidotransferase subunit C
MSEITPDLVRHLAGLSRILVTDEEVERFTEQLSLIVDSVAKVNEALAGLDVPSTSHPIPMANVFREDVVEPSLTQAQALSGAPDSGEGRFRVAAILDEE